MKSRIYADTSVVGGYLDEEFQKVTIKLFEEFKSGIKTLVLSDLTLKELELAPPKVRDILSIVPEKNKEYIFFDKKVQFLSTKYIEEKTVSEKYLLDAQHIALATIYHVDVLVSWNFKHIVNLRRIQLYNSINLKYGYSLVEIRSPREVINEE
ncbi:MAG: PIN domain protein [Actinobacteria bacterium]|nr:PIN domain protein [Actinomycetota bacterium]